MLWKISTSFPGFFCKWFNPVKGHANEAFVSYVLRVFSNK